MACRKLPYIFGELQFISASTYRKTTLFRSERLCRCFVEALADVRRAEGYLLIGWGFTPGRFHLLF